MRDANATLPATVNAGAGVWAVVSVLLWAWLALVLARNTTIVKKMNGQNRDPRVIEQRIGLLLSLSHAAYWNAASGKRRDAAELLLNSK
jgi:hypothetical protein